MNKKNEILKKYNMFLKIKLMIIFLGIVSTLSFTGFFIMKTKQLILVSNLMLMLSIIGILIFLILWISLSPIKKHLIELIKECEK